jgi:hypothetical protein
MRLNGFEKRIASLEKQEVFFASKSIYLRTSQVNLPAFRTFSKVRYCNSASREVCCATANISAKKGRTSRSALNESLPGHEHFGALR